MKIKIISKSINDLQAFSTTYFAGMNIRADLDQEIILGPMERTQVKTGLFLELPVGFEARIRQESGLAISKGIAILNSPKTIDSDYEAEVCIILVNLSQVNFVVKDGDRIC